MNTSDADTDDGNEVVESDDEGASNDDDTPINDELEIAMDEAEVETPLGGEEGEE